MKDIMQLCDTVRQTAYDIQIKKYVLSDALRRSAVGPLMSCLLNFFAFFAFFRG